MLIRLIASGQPVSAKNHQIPIITTSGKARIIKSAAITKWYARVVPEIEGQWRAYARPTITDPVHVTVHQYLQHPLASDANPDGDNVQSGAWDALQKAQVIRNDRQVIAWAGTKQHDATRPRIEIEVRVLHVRAA
jgi:Holliday junction resolvase RusA-like endonuclease